jgi:hypothetical protein
LAERWNGTKWAVQTTPNPSGDWSSQLTGVSCTATNACIAVGGGFATSGVTATLAERWNGTKWALQTTRNPSASRFNVLTSVSCATAIACTAVGNSVFHAAPLAERWNGTSWTITAAPSPANAAFSELGGVSCTSASACSAVGGFAAGTDFAFYDGSQATFAEHSNGARWTLQTTPSPIGAAPSSLQAVSCNTGSACSAVGSFDTSGASHQQTLAERWNGTSWTIQRTPNPAGAKSNAFTGASCATAMACTAVGYSDSAPLAEGWNGSTWVIKATPEPSGSVSSQLTGVSCTAATACTAVGSYTDSASAQLTLAEHWNGTSWVIQPTPNPPGATNFQFGGVSCTSATACTAVGSYTNNAAAQLTLAEQWSGTSWVIQSTPNPSGGTSIQLSGVSCTSATACTAVGSYLNGGGFQTLSERWNGTSWAIETTPTPSFSGFGGDSCAAATACVAVGNVFAEGWDGTTWAARTLASPSGGNLSSLSGVSCTSATACSADGSFDRSFQIGFAYSFGSQALVSLPLAERYS